MSLFDEDEDEDIYTNPFYENEDPYDLEYDDEEPDETTSVLSSIATSSPQIVQQAPQQVPQQAQQPIAQPQTSVFPLAQTPVTPTTQNVPTERAVRPTPATDWSNLFGDESTQRASRGNFLDQLREQGLWGDQYGDPVGQGRVEIGGASRGPTPSYITGVTTRTTQVPGTAPSPGRAPSQAAPASAPTSVDISMPDTMDTSSREANIKQWAPALARIEQETGLSAQAIGGLIIAENGGGQSSLSRTQNNYFSIAYTPGNKWQTGSQAMASDNPTMGVYKNPMDSLQDFVELISTSPRYAEAWAVRHDPARFHEELAKAGYIENVGDNVQKWLRTLTSTREQYSDIAGSVKPAPPESAQARDTYAQPEKPPTLRGITPSQADYAINVDTQDGWAMCSLFAAAGQFASLGINVDPAAMKSTAAKYGWNTDDGQAGPQAHVKMFNDLAQQNGTDARAVYEDGIDWTKVRGQVAQGRPVVLNAMTTNGKIGHYYVVEDYDPDTQRYYLGNSLTSLRVGKATGGWVTPEELYALQSQTQLNTTPTGAIYLQGGEASVARPAGPRPTGTPPTTQPAPSAPTTSTETSFSMAPGVSGVSGPAIRADVGNRPVTLTDIAFGTWHGPSAPTPMPPQVNFQVQQPAPVSTTENIPDWRRQRAAEAQAEAARPKPAPLPAELAEIDQAALEKEHQTAREYQQEFDAYIKETARIAEQNMALEKDYQDRYTAGLITGSGQAQAGRSTYGEGGDEGPASVSASTEIGEDRPAYHEYPHPPTAPKTPNLDKLAAFANKRKLEEWAAAGSDPATKPAPYYTLPEIEQKGREFMYGARGNEERVANEYGQLVGEARTKFIQDRQAEQERQAGLARAASFVPANEYARFVEANASQGTATVSTDQAVDYGIKPAEPQVLSRPDEIDAVPELTDEIKRARVATLREAEFGTGVESHPLTLERQAEDQLRSEGYLPPEEKARLKGQLAQGQAINTARDIQTEQAIRQASPTGYAGTVPSVVMDLGEGFQDVLASSGAGLMGAGRVLNIPSLQEYGAGVMTRADEANRVEEYDPRSKTFINKVFRAAPSVIASVAVAIPVTLAAVAVGAPAAGVAATGMGAGMISTFLQEGGSAYSQALQEGATQEQASAALLLQGSLNAAIESLPVGRALNQVPGGKEILASLGRKLFQEAVPSLAAKLTDSATGRLLISRGANVLGADVQNFLAEGGQEWVQEAVGIAVENLYKDSSFMQLLEERGRDAFLVGGTLGVATETVGQAAQVIPNDKLWASVYGALLPERSGTQPSDTPSTVTALQPPQQVGPTVPLNFPFEQAVPSPDAAPGTRGAQVASGLVPGTQGPAGPTAVSPQAGQGPRTLQGIDQPLLEAKFDLNGDPTYNRNNLDTEAVPDWTAAVNQHTTESEGIRMNTASPLERVTEAVQNMAIMENVSGGLNADQRAALLEDYGVEGQDVRTIAAVAGYHIAQNPRDAGLITDVLQNMLGRPSGPKDVATFQKRVNQALSTRVTPQQSAAAPTSAPTPGPGATTTPQPVRPPTVAQIRSQNEEKAFQNLKNNIDQHDRLTLAGVQVATGLGGAPSARILQKLKNEGLLDGQGRVVRMGPPVPPAERKTAAEVRAETEAAALQSLRDNIGEHQRLTSPVIQSVTGLSQAAASRIAATLRTEGLINDRGFVQAAPTRNTPVTGQNQPTAAPTVPENVSTPQTAGVAPPAPVEPVMPQTSPSAPEVLDATGTISPNRRKGSLLGKVAGALPTSEDAEMMYEALGSIRKENKVLTNGDLVEYLETIYGDQPDVLSSILNKAGLGGIRGADGAVRQIGATRSPAPTPTRAPGTKRGGKKAATSAPRGDSGAPAGQKRVWIEAPTNTRFEQGANIAQGKRRVEVYDRPNQAGVGSEFFNMQPVLVNENDIQIDADGTQYIAAPDGVYVPQAAGALAVDREALSQAEEAARAVKDRRAASKGSANVDLISAVNIPGDGRMYFQQDEVSPADRQRIAESRALQSLGNMTQNLFTTLSEGLQNSFPGLPSQNTMDGFAWMPRVLGATSINRTLGVFNKAITWMNPHSMYNNALMWGAQVGVAPNSEDFRRYLAGLQVGTMIHEILHTLPDDATIDETGHGASHTAAIKQALDELDIAALQREAYQAWTPEVMEEVQVQTALLEESVGKSVDQAAQAQPAPEAQPTPTPQPTSQAAEEPVNTRGLNIINGDSRSLFSRENQRTLQRLKAGIAEVLAQQNRETFSMPDPQARTDAIAKARRFESLAQSNGRDITSYFTIMDEMFGTDTFNQVVERLGIDGVSYTTGEGTRTDVFPHARRTQGEHNAATAIDTETTRARESRLDNGPLGRGDAGRGLAGTGELGRSSPGAQRNESRAPLRTGSEGTLRDANLGRDYGVDRAAGGVGGDVSLRALDGAFGRQGGQDGYTLLDEANPVSLPNLPYAMLFQKDELSLEQRQAIANRPYMTGILATLGDYLSDVTETLGETYPEIALNTVLEGGAWVPGILGYVEGSRAWKEGDKLVTPQVYINVHSAFALTIDMMGSRAIGTPAFTESFIGTLIGTLVHETAHTIPLPGLDDTQHGPAHTEAIETFLNEQTELVQEIESVLEANLSPESLRELETDTYALAVSVSIGEDTQALLETYMNKAAEAQRALRGLIFRYGSEENIPASARQRYTDLQVQLDELASFMDGPKMFDEVMDELTKHTNDLVTEYGIEFESKMNSYDRGYYNALQEQLQAARDILDRQQKGNTNANRTIPGPTTRSGDGTTVSGDGGGQSPGSLRDRGDASTTVRTRVAPNLSSRATSTSRQPAVGRSASAPSAGRGRRRNAYVPGTRVRRSNSGAVARNTRPPVPLKNNQFWSPSQGKAITWSSQAELKMFRILENAMHEANPQLSPHGRVVEWRSEENWDGSRLSYRYSDRGKIRGFEPDLLVAYEDGHQEIIEVKRTDAPQEEDSFFRSEAKRSRGMSQSRAGWHVKAKAISMITGLPLVDENVEMGFRLIAQHDPLITGQPATPRQQSFIDFYNRVNEIAATIPYSPALASIADPVERYKATARQVRQAVLEADQGTFASTEGSVRAGEGMIFVADPFAMTPFSSSDIAQFIPGAAQIIRDHTPFGVTIDSSAVGQDPRTGAQSALLSVRGDIDAFEKMAAEMAKSAGVASNSRTVVFAEDSRGTDFVHSIDLLADEALSSALAGYADPDGPTLLLTYDKDGLVDRVVLTSRTQNGSTLTEFEFMKIRDSFTDLIEELGVDTENIYTAKGVITHFDDPREGGVDNAITRRAEILGQAPLGRSVPPPAQTAADLPIGTPRGRPARQYAPRAETRQGPDLLAGQPLNPFPDFGGVSLLPPANQTPTLSAETQALEDTVSVVRARVQNPPGQPAGQGRLPPVPNLHLEKFSREAKAPIRAAAIAIMAAGGPSPTTTQDAIRHLGTNAQDFARSRASKLTPIELAAVMQVLNTSRANIENIARHFANPNTPRPTEAQLRDFIMEGLKYQAMHNQLKNDAGQTREAAQLFTRAKQQTQKGETVQQHIDRLLGYAKTSEAKGKDFAGDFIRQFHTGTLLGATSYQMASVWDKALNPHTVIGDWMLAIMYNGMLGPATAGVAFVWNNIELHWRILRDIFTNALKGVVGSTTQAITGTPLGGMTMDDSLKQLTMEAKGYALGFFNAWKAFYQTFRYGTSLQNMVLGDVPTSRLQRNVLPSKVLSTAADKAGLMVETFFGRFFSAADQFTKAWVYSLELGRQSAVESARLNNGRVDLQQAQNLFSNPTEAMMERAGQVGLETVFQGKMGKFGEILAMIQNYGILGRFFFPFLRTIYHGLVAAADRSPAGVLWTAYDIAKTAEGKNFFQVMLNPTSSDYLMNRPNKIQTTRLASQRLMDAVLGSAAYALIWEQLTEGAIDITGEPPDDERERDQFQRAGKIPYGIRFTKWLGENSPMYSYANWGAIAPGLAFIAEFDKAGKRSDTPPETAYGVAAYHFLKGVTSMSFVSTLAMVMEAAAGDAPDDKFMGTPLSRILEDQFASRMPWIWGAALMRTGQIQDPYARYPDTKESIPKRLAQIASTRMPAYVPFSETLFGHKRRMEGTIPERIEVPEGIPVLGGMNVPNPILPGQRIGRETLKPSLDVWGFPITNPFYDAPSEGANVLGVPIPAQALDVVSGVGQLFNPFRGVPATQDPVDQELARLKEAGLNKLPSRAPREYNKHKFTEDEMWEWRRRVGQDSYARLNWLFNQPAYQAAPMTGEGSKDRMIEEQYREAKEVVWESLGIVDPGAEPDRNPKFYGIKEEAAKRGVPWWQFEKEVEQSISKWNDYRDALKSGRRPPTMTPEEIRTAAQYSRSHDRMETLEAQRARTEVKRVGEDYPGIPFTALPPIP